MTRSFIPFTAQALLSRSFFLLSVWSLSTFALAAQSETVKVLASIQPLGLIAHEIGAGVTEVDVLVPAGASPHDFALRPSDRKRIADADLLLWVGPTTEPYLDRIASSVSQDLPWIIDSQSDSDHADEHDHHQDLGKGHNNGEGHGEGHQASHMDTRAAEEGHSHHDEEPKAESAHAPAHGHDHSDDAHPWLDPIAALNYASRFAASLSAMRPDDSARIASNLDSFRTQLTQLDQQLSRQFEPVRDKGFLVFHRAYDALVEHYQLNQLDALMLDPSRKPGAKQMQRLRELVESGRVSCVFVEPQFNAGLLETLVRNTGVRQGVLDPVASDFSLSQSSYVEYMASLSGEIIRCLAKD